MDNPKAYMSDCLTDWFRFPLSAMRDDRLDAIDIHLLILVQGRRTKLGWTVRELSTEADLTERAARRRINQLIDFRYLTKKDSIRPISYHPVSFVKALRKVMADKTLSPTNKATYLRIQSHGYGMNELSYRQVAQYTKERRETIKEHIADLESTGFARCIPSNAYVQCMDLYTGDDMWF